MTAVDLSPAHSLSRTLIQRGAAYVQDNLVCPYTAPFIGVRHSSMGLCGGGVAEMGSIGPTRRARGRLRSSTWRGEMA
jgi:hypothetical protein